MIKNRYKKPKKRGIKLTVCVATINNNNFVTGASDRMITAGDIQYQPDISKIWIFTKSIAVLVGGDIPTQKTIFDNVRDAINEGITKNPLIWWRVKDVASLYASQYNREKNLAIQRKILSPFGLTHKTYIEKQNQMSKEFIKQISDKIDEFEFPEIETLIIGFDEVGPHIFTILNNEVICNDSFGFAAIGAGAYHAESHLMFNRYSPTLDSIRALLYTHRAKKIAETAPGVGSETDMIVIGIKLGFYWILPRDFISTLDGFYGKYKEEIKQTDDKNLSKIDPFIKEYTKDKLTIEMAQRAIKSMNGTQPINSNNSSSSQT